MESAGIQIAMDDRGRWIDNVFIERLRRTLKHEYSISRAMPIGRDLREGLADWIAFYNSRRFHQHRMID